MTAEQLLHQEKSKSIIAAFYAVYDELGFGFMEHIHSAAMERELTSRGHSVKREELVPVYFKGEVLSHQRIDMVVDGTVVIEIKSSALMPPKSLRQLHNYLYATDYELGFLFHFGTEPKFHRRVLTNDRKRRSSRGAISEPAASPEDQPPGRRGEFRNEGEQEVKDQSPRQIQSPGP